MGNGQSDQSNFLSFLFRGGGRVEQKNPEKIDFCKTGVTFRSVPLSVLRFTIEGLQGYFFIPWYKKFHRAFALCKAPPDQASGSQ